MHNTSDSDIDGEPGGDTTEPDPEVRRGFAELAEQDRRWLCQCAWVGLIPEVLAARVSGNPDEECRLARLERHTSLLSQESHAVLGRCYRLRADVCRWLQQLARAETDQSRLDLSRSAWAKALCSEAHWPLALELLQMGQTNWLAESLRWIPDSLFADEPCLRLWRACCRAQSDTGFARRELAQCWMHFESEAEAKPMALAWSGLVDTIWLDWKSVADYLPWLEALAPHETWLREQLPPALWYRLVRSVTTALVHANPQTPALRYWHHEVVSALTNPAVGANDRLMMAAQLLYLGTWLSGRRVYAEFACRAVVQAPDLLKQASPLARCMWWTFHSFHQLLFCADSRGCFDSAERARDLIREHRIQSWECAVPALQSAICTLDAEAMETWMQWLLRSECKSHRPFYDRFQTHFLASQAWLQGETSLALDYAGQSVELLHPDDRGVTPASLRAVYARLLAGEGQPREALRQARAARRALAGASNAYAELLVYQLLGVMASEAGREARALAYLRRAFGAGAREGLFFPYMLGDRELASLCAMALGAQVEPDYVRRLIRLRALPPPPKPADQLVWPWRCRLQLLGRFDLEVSGQASGRITRAKERALLSELILAGPQGLAQETLSRSLWPDSPALKAVNSLHVTLHRLRERMCGQAGVVTESGRIRIDPETFWVDVWALSELGDQAQSLSEQQLLQAVALYEGPPQLEVADELQQGIHKESLLLAYRRLVVELARRWVRSGRGDPLGLSWKALKHLPLDEDVWRLLLHSQAHSMRALQDTYEQLCLAYDKALGMPPPEPLRDDYDRLVTGSDTAGPGM